MFKNINFSSDVFLKYLEMQFINQDDRELFMNLINQDYISISGSSILQIIQQEFYQNTDLDIYIEITNFDNSKIKNIHNLIRFLSNFIENKNSIINYYQEIQSVNFTNHNFISNNPYFSLRKYIKLFQLFENKQTNFKIELIFIKCDIEYMLKNTFDYDIIKNYWKQNKIYSLNYLSISNKTATMTLDHFINRILFGSKKEFTNFIDRYNKYSNRGFKMFIHKTYITNQIFNHIITIYFSSAYPLEIYLNGKMIKYNNYKEMVPYYFYRDIKLFRSYEFPYDILSNNLSILTIIIPDYILKYIIIAGIVQKHRLYKNLNNFSNYLLEKYLHPESPYILYKGLQWKDHTKNNIKKICYINNSNKLLLLSI